MSSNPLIRFLAAYGPIPASDNMYDEFVKQQAEKLGLKQIDIQEGRSGEIVSIFRCPDPDSVILTGTAGDGKTYTARRVFEQLGGLEKDWNTGAPEIPLPISETGIRIVFVKDLSELTDDEKKQLFPRLLRALRGEGNERFLVCVNDGHLLKTWREYGGEDDEIYRVILEMLRNGQEQSHLLKLHMINMSRRSHAEVLDAIINEITGHPGWKRCQDCSALANTACPIRKNREILQEMGEATIRNRLRQLVTLAAADGEHLSIRQLIIVIVNALLGYGGDPDRPLLDCDLAQQCAEHGEYHLTNPFIHIFGENLPLHRRNQYKVFYVLGRFGIGNETIHYFDEGLLGLLPDCDLPDHETYGGAIFNAIRDDYLNAPQEKIETFRSAIRAQRQRLFFMVPESASPWKLTLYHSAELYFELLRPKNEQDPKRFKKARRMLVKGINRTLTGTLTESDEALWLIEPSGVFLGREVPMISISPIEWGDNDPYYFVLAAPGIPGRPPRLEIWSGTPKEKIETLDITPTLFEYLYRISQGALPTSFSNQCLKDIRNFQSRTVGRIHAAEKRKGRNRRLWVVDIKAERLRRDRILVLENTMEEA